MALNPVTGIEVNGEIQPVSYPHLHGKTAVEFTEQTLTDEQKAQARTNIDVPSLDTLNAVETQLNGSVSANKKQIENLKKLAQGKIYDFETDATEAYVKDVPTGAAPYAAMKAVGGKSIVWNQLISVSDINASRFNASATAVKNNDGSVTVTYIPDTSGVPVTNWSGVTLPDREKDGRKYLYSANIYPSFTTKIGLTVSGEHLTVVCEANKETKVATIRSGDSAIKKGVFVKAETSGEAVEGSTVTISKIQLIDLTLMFGAGNEPATVEEFNAMFSADYYPFNEGEIVSAEVQNVKSVGSNVLPYVADMTPKTVNGITVTPLGDGKYLINGTRTDTKYGATIQFYLEKPFSVKAGDTFYYKLRNDKNYAYISVGVLGVIDRTTNPINRIVFYDAITKEYTGYKFNIYVNTDTVDNLIIQPSVEHVGGDTEYVPYKENNFPIPEAVKNLEGYGWSAGSVCNEVDFERKVFVKRVEKIVLTGNEGTYTGYKAPLSGPPYVAMFKNLLTEAKYAKELNSDGSSKIIIGLSDAGMPVLSNSMNWVPAGGIGIWRDTIAIGFDEVKTKEEVLALLPITIYYELATPEEIDISDILTDDNLIEVEQGGTLTFENAHGDSFRLPVPSSVEYMINLQEATA